MRSLLRAARRGAVEPARERSLRGTNCELWQPRDCSCSARRPASGLQTAAGALDLYVQSAVCVRALHVERVRCSTVVIANYAGAVFQPLLAGSGYRCVTCDIGPSDGPPVQSDPVAGLL